MLEPGKIIGPFRIKRELGAGAMGMVYKAVFTENEQPVAIKIIGIGMAGNETAIARFEREAEILKQLRHPHIVRLYGAGRYKKTPFIAMEYVRGESLDKMLERRGQLPWQEVVSLGKQLCLALQHAHERGIIHRDLKPSNLMLLKDGTLKLADFGIAKDTDVTALTGANSTVGTAAYMSPEQCRGERTLTNKSDLYSLGVVFYELLTGEKPFKKESPVDMFLAHVSEPIERPSRKVLDIPPWLDTLICQLMEKKPEHRPFDAAMVKRVLDEVQEKMDEQRSAGLDLATARVADRPDAVRSNDADRDAARALRGTGRKKKPRAKTVRFYEKGSFTAATLIVVLLGLGGLTWWLLRPPSPEVLFHRADLAMQSGNTELAQATIAQFIETYPDRRDAEAQQLRSWLEKLATDRLARQMHNRYSGKHKALDEQQQIVFDAMRSEDAGEFDDARKNWQKLSDQFKDAKSVEDQSWHWLAQRNLKAIDFAGREKDWQTKWVQLDFKPATESERRAYAALRYEWLGDLPAAAAIWTKMKTDYASQEDARACYLWATYKLAALKSEVATDGAKIKAHRREIVAVQVGRVAKEVQNDHRVARALARDLEELYGKDADTELAPLIKQATTIVATLPSPKESK